MTVAKAVIGTLGFECDLTGLNKAALKEAASIAAEDPKELVNFLSKQPAKGATKEEAQRPNKTGKQNVEVPEDGVHLRSNYKRQILTVMAEATDNGVYLATSEAGAK